MGLITRMLSIAGLASGSAAMASGPLELGAALPAVQATDQDGKTWNLAEDFSTGWLVVFFYPRANTPGCTAQACSLRDAWSDLSEMGVRVLGVSNDSVERQKQFQQNHNLPYSLLADTDGAVVGAFGVPTRLGFASRQAFLFKDGKLVWRDLKASTRAQGDDVKQALASLSGD